MRTCDEMTQLISAKLDGALSPAEEAEFNRHLEVCPACRALYADLAALQSIMPGLNVEPPPALLQGVMDQIGAEAPAPIPFPDEEARKRRNQRKWRTWGATAAVLAVVVLGTATLRLFDGANSSGAAPAAMAGGESAPEAYAAPRDSETDGAAQAKDSAAGGAPDEGGLQSAMEPQASQAIQAAPTPAPTAGASDSAEAPVQDQYAGAPEPRLALRSSGTDTAESAAQADPPSPAEQTAPAENAAQADPAPQPDPTAAPEPGLQIGPAIVSLELTAPLTETEALERLYEERFAADYPDGAYTRSEGFEGYTLSPLAPLEEGGSLMAEEYLGVREWSENGAYYLVEHFTQTIDASNGQIVEETVWDRYAVPLVGGDILTEREDPDAFLSAVTE